MERYDALAGELFAALDRTKGVPPHDDISAGMRGEMAVLRLLERESAALTAGEISRALRMTTSRVAAVLNSLQKKKLIVRQTDEDDRRRVRVQLTPSGITLCQIRKKHAIHHLSSLLARLGEEDAALFVRLMKRVFVILPTILPPPPLCSEDDAYCSREECHEQ